MFAAIVAVLAVLSGGTLAAQAGWEPPAPVVGSDTPVTVEDLPPVREGPHPDGFPVGVVGGSATAAGSVGWVLVTGVATVLCTPCLFVGCGALCFSPALGWTALLALAPLVMVSHGVLAVSMAVQAGLTALAPGWFQGRTQQKMVDLLAAQAAPLLLGWTAAGMLFWAAAGLALLGTASAGYLGLTSQTELAPTAMFGFGAAAFVCVALAGLGMGVGLLGQVTALVFAVLVARQFAPDAERPPPVVDEEKPKPKKKKAKKKKKARGWQQPAPDENPPGWGDPPLDEEHQ